MPRDRRTSGLGTATIALITAAVALLSSGAGLVFDLFPGLRPDPRDRRAAELAVVTLERDVSVADWLRRTSKDDAELERRTAAYLDRGDDRQAPTARSAAGRAELALAGNLFYVNATIEGLKRDRVLLRWSLHDARSGRRSRDRGYHDVDAVDVPLDAPSDRSVLQVWTPIAIGRGPWFVRFELRDRDGTMLAIGDSGRFTGLG